MVQDDPSGLDAPRLGEQRFEIGGRVWAADDPALQDALAAIHDTQQRPRCLCIPAGVEMYVARHRRYLVKRLP